MSTPFAVPSRAFPPAARVKLDVPSAVQKPHLLEWVFAVFTLVTYQGAFFPVLRTLRQGAQSTEVGDPIARYAILSILVVQLFLLATGWRQMSHTIIRVMWPYWVFVALCFVSVLWCDTPDLAFRRSVSLFSCFLFAAYAYVRFGPRRFVVMIAVTAGVAAFASLVLVVVAPSVASDPTYFETNAIRGVYSQKNEMSAYNVLGLCASLALIFLEKGTSAAGKRFYLFLSALMVVALIFSRGLSSMVAFGLVLFVLIIYYERMSWRLRLLGGYLFFIGMVIVGFLLVVDANDLLGAAGKDASLTGRLPIWVESMRAIGDRPLFGYGYAAFWDLNLPRTQDIWQRIGWQAPSAHNGYLETILGVGFVGCIFYLLICGRTTLLAIRFSRFDVPGLKWFMLFLTTLFVVNFDEGTLAWPDAMAIETAFGTCMVEACLVRYRMAQRAQ